MGEIVPILLLLSHQCVKLGQLKMANNLLKWINVRYGGFRYKLGQFYSWATWKLTAPIHYPVIIKPDLEDGGYIAQIPMLKGSIAHGKTVNKTMRLMAEIESEWLDIAHDKGWVIPTYCCGDEIVGTSFSFWGRPDDAEINEV